MLENLDLFFLDPLISVPVSYGDVRTRGILDAADQLLDAGLIQSDKHTLMVKTSDFPDEPVSGDLIMVDGIGYEVNIPFAQMDDGKIAVIGLQRPI